MINEHSEKIMSYYQFDSQKFAFYNLNRKWSRVNKRIISKFNSDAYKISQMDDDLELMIKFNQGYIFETCVRT